MKPTAMVRTGTMPRPGSKAGGFSLIELMVALAIGLVVSLAIFSVLSASEGRRRTTTAVNDISQSGSYVAYMVDKAVRSAGSGFKTVWSQAYGCTLNVERASGRVLPRAAAFPAPFGALPLAMNLAPVVIFDGAGADGSDVIATMAGTAGFGEAAVRMTSGAVNELRVRSTVGYSANDLVLMGHAGSDCLLAQVGTPVGVDSLPLAGQYTVAAGATINMANILALGDPYIAALGNAAPTAAGTATNPPQFRLMGIGDNRTLFAYDLLNVTGNAPLPMADGVFDMQAIYGVTSGPADRTLDNWVAPTGGTWGSAALMPSGNNLRRIVAVRIGLIMRSSLAERDPVSPTEIKLFRDEPTLTYTRTLSTADRAFRYRTFEITVPVRNNILP